MKIIPNPTTITPEEAVMNRVSQESAAALTHLKAATVFAFHQLWDDEESIQEKLDLMGMLAVANFDQHARTVTFLLQSGVEMEPADYVPPRAYTKHDDGTITLNQV